MRLIVAITGASGVIYGKRLLKVLQEKNVETHLIISKAAERVIEHELEKTKEDIEKLADHAYDVNDWNAPIVSGSFRTDGMIIIPCSMKTLGGIASGYADSLLLRTADVCLKERQKLVLVTRETPLNLIHIENMRKVTLAGGVILPPVITMYSKPKSVKELVDHIVGKVLDSLGIENEVYKRWC